jgi:CRISPR-associated endonuclease/helicase Cas3
MLFAEPYKKVEEYLIERGRGKYEERPYLDELINVLSSDSSNYLVTAPTGYGKTAISMSIALGSFNEFSKSIIAYPLRSLIEEQVDMFRKLFDFVGIGKDFVGARYMGRHESPYLIHPVTLTTIDTLSLTALGLSPEDMYSVLKGLSSEDWFKNLGHYLFSWSSVFSSSNIILDEVHSMYDTSKSLSFLVALMDLCSSTDVRLLLMTATLPRSFEQALSGRVKVRRYTRDDDPKFFDERLHKNYRVELLGLKGYNKFEIIKEILLKNEFSKALVIFNTVEDAVDFYRLLDGKKILIHSRFSVEDREAKLHELRALEDSPGKMVLVSTQAVEAGVDFSSDLIITEIAPPISLVQRFGRFLRRDEKSGRAFVWFEEDGFYNDTYKVYNADLVKRTIDFLSGNNDVNLHVGYDVFLDHVYVDPPTVDNRLINKIRNVFWDLIEPSKSALELLIKLEGSFVRDGYLVTVVTDDNVEVNVNYEYLLKLKRKGLCVECTEDKREVLLRSLRGHKFYVNIRYDKEVGLV